MKKLLTLLLPFFLFSCNDKKEDPQSTPENVVNTVFNAAKTKDYSKLSTLCSPEADGDCKHICDLKEEDKESFISYFSKGKINGKATIEGDNAKVPILFGPEGTKDETMNLVKKEGKWYLMSF